jgi:hypothetical protein
VKIVAQSIVVPSMPYVHLGYTAAAYRPRPRDAGSAGSVVMTLAVVVLFVLTVAKNAPDGTPITHLRKWGWLFLCSAGFLTLVGFALLVWKEKLPVYADPVARTHEQGLRLLKEVADLRAQHKPIPDAPDNIFYVGSRKSGLDGWNAGMRTVQEDIDGVKVFFVASAGPDHNFNTDDDIRMFLGPYGELRTAVGKGKTLID